MDAVRQTLRLAGGEVSYLEWLPHHGPASSTLLLLHGGGLDSAALSWGEVGPALASAGHRVLAPDHPGYGESPAGPWPATQERLVSYVGELVDALGLDQYVIGGLSLGGGMTIGHVLQRPQEVTGAILLGSYGLMDHQLDGWYAAPAHVVTWAMLRTGILSAMVRAYGKDRKRMESSVRTVIRDPRRRTPELIDEIMLAAEDGKAFVAFEQWQRDQFLWNRLRTNYLDQLASVRRPVLMIHGDRDSGVPVGCAVRAAEEVPEARLVVIPDAGHWVQRDRPDLVLPAMIDFLSSLE